MIYLGGDLGFYFSILNQDARSTSHIQFNMEGSVKFKSMIFLPVDVPQNLIEGGLK